MLTVAGIFENGKVELLQKVNASSKRKVLVTFVDEDNEDDNIRSISLLQTTEEMQAYLSNKMEDIYQDYLKK